MDIATVLGLLLGLGLVLTSIMMGSGGLAPFINIPSAMITIGGSFAAILINFPLKPVLSLPAIIMNCFFDKLPNPNEVIGQFTEFAAIARKDGLLALDAKTEEIKDPFMRNGLVLVVAGMSKEDIELIMDVEVNYIDERHKMGKKIIDALGAAAPAFGMVGTLIGLVQMLRSLDDPSQIGGGMATALLTTLYGALMANLFCIPLAGKLEARNKDEIMVRELIVSGLVGLIEGHPPRSVHGRLAAFLSPASRPSEESATAA